MAKFRKHFTSLALFALVAGVLFNLKTNSALALIDLGLLGVGDNGEAEIDANVGVEVKAPTSTIGDNSVDNTVDSTTTLYVSVDRANIEGSGTSSVEAIEPEDVMGETDLRAFAFGAMQSDSNVRGMKFDGESIEVIYEEEGYLLALMPIKFPVKVTAYADGDVEVRYPWYSFLTIDNRYQIESEVKMAVDLALSEEDVGSVRAEGLPENPRFSTTESAYVASAIQEVLKASFHEAAAASSTN